MDAVATGRMEEFARMVLKLSPEMQTEFFAEMVKTGLMNAEEAEGLKVYVGLYHMYTDQNYYNKIRNGALQMYMNAIKG